MSAQTPAEFYDALKRLHPLGELAMVDGIPHLLLAPHEVAQAKARLGADWPPDVRALAILVRAKGPKRHGAERN